MLTLQSLTADVLVVGAGLAGLHTATRLAELGHDVLLAERRADLTIGIRTTGIFVRRTLDDFTLPEEHLGPPIRRVVLYPPSLRHSVELACLRLSAHAVAVIDEALRTGTTEPLRHYDGAVLRSTSAGASPYGPASHGSASRRSVSRRSACFGHPRAGPPRGGFSSATARSPTSTR